MIDNTEINKFVEDRKEKRKQLKTAKNSAIRNALKTQIEHSFEDEKKQELNDIEEKNRKKQAKRQQFINEFYDLNRKMIQYYRVLGLIRSDHKINEYFHKSSSYFQASEKQNHFPQLDFLTEIIDDIDCVIFNLDSILNENFNKESVRIKLEQLKNNYKRLKIAILQEYYI